MQGNHLLPFMCLIYLPVGCSSKIFAEFPKINLEFINSVYYNVILICGLFVDTVCLCFTYICSILS